MKVSDYFMTLKGATHENKINRGVMIALVLCNLGLMIALNRVDTRVILVPPSIDEKLEISSESANAGFYELWGDHIASMLGNVNPTTADFLIDRLGKIAAPNVHKDLIESVSDQVRKIKDENLTIQFTPTQVFFIPEDKVVVVSGQYVLRGIGASEEKSIRTYEIGLSIRSSKVALTSIESYSGAWTPNRDELEEMKLREQKRKEADANRNLSKGAG